MATITINKGEWAKITDSTISASGAYCLLKGFGIFASLPATATPTKYEDGKGNFLKKCNVNSDISSNGTFSDATTTAELFLYAFNDVEIDVKGF